MLDEAAFEGFEPGSGSIQISLASQRLALVNPWGERVLERDYPTGKSGKDSPAGTFRAGFPAAEARSWLLAPPRVNCSASDPWSPELVGWAPWGMHVRRKAGGGWCVTPHGASAGRQPVVAALQDQGLRSQCV